MKELSEALFTKFNEVSNGSHHPLYDLVSGKFYKERAPQKATLPYVVYHIISIVPEWTFTTNFEKFRIQFDLFSNSNDSTQVENMYTGLRELFDWRQLVVDGYDHVYMRRELARLVRDPEDDAWEYNVDYEIYIEQQ
jgi:hypothetical protein